MCGIKLKRLSTKFSLLLFLFLSSSLLSINAMDQQDILNNLQVSEQLLGTLNSQLSQLETELDNKNRSLLSLQSANQELNLQLTNLQEQYKSQTDTLNSLSLTNQQLTDQLVLLEGQSTDLNQQYLQLSKELSKQGSNDIWYFLGGLVIGGLAVGLTCWLLT